MRKAILFLTVLAIQQTAFAEMPKTVGGHLVDEKGMSLYVFDKDGKSACTGGCAEAWPAATADSYDKPSGAWSVIPSADGKQQWTYKGHPLYRFAKDTSPGDMKGDGFKDVWHIAKP